MLRFCVIVFSLLPVWAQAQCTGAGFWEQLSNDQQTALLDQSAQVPFGAGNTWSAQKDDTTLTIVGTMHLPDPRHETLIARTTARLDAADLLLVEATLDDQTAMQTHMARNPDLMTLNDGTTLPDVLDDPTWQAVRAAAQDRGVPGFIAAKMQPWFLSMTLAIPPCAMQQLSTGQGGLDNLLMRAAIDRAIPVAPLEPWQDMFDLLTMGTFEEQLDALRLGILSPELQGAMMVSLLDFYFAEQTAIGWNMSYLVADFLPEEDRAAFADQMELLEQLLLVDRNAAWIPVIEDAAARHDTIFIAFGAAHLFGDTGVLALLENEGWVITPF